MTARSPIAYARVALGVLFLVRTTPLLHAFRAHVPFAYDTFPLLGWPAAGWTVPVAGLALPSLLVGVLCVVRTVAALLFTVGVRKRTAGSAAALAGYLVLAQDRFAFIDSLQVLFLATLVLALCDDDADRASNVRFVSLFLASIYGWAGVAKLQSAWLSGRALATEARGGAFAGPLGAWVAHASVRAVATWLVPATELAIAALLVADRRRHAVVLALAFHLGLELTVNPDLLGWQMAILLVAVWPRRISCGAS